MKITDVFREDRPNQPFGLRWWVQGKAKHKFFASEDERATHRKKLEKQFSKEGELPFTMTAADAVEWHKAKALLTGRELTILDAVQGYLSQSSVVREKRTLGDAIETYLAARKSEGVGADYLRHVKTVLQDYQRCFGDRLEVSPEEAREWLYGQSAAPQTLGNYRRQVGTFYRFALQHQWVQDSPWRIVKAPRVVQKPIETLTVEQAAYLFRANQDQHSRVLARLALEAFAGLRYSSACRLAYDDVKWEQRGILLPADKIKTQRRQFIDGLPDNLWRWLELCKKRGEDWQITERNYLYAKSAAFDRATLLYRQEHAAGDPEGQIPHPHNVLRHSFATYHCAMNKSPARTAAILCHRSEAKLWAHYKGAATEEQGKEYFKIKPGIRS